VGGQPLGWRCYTDLDEKIRRRSSLRVGRRSETLGCLPIGIGRSGAAGIGRPAQAGMRRARRVGQVEGGCLRMVVRQACTVAASQMQRCLQSGWVSHRDCER
jgi:hypothetical protein